MIRFFKITTIFFFICNAVEAQTLIQKVWPGEIPGAIVNTSYIERTGMLAMGRKRVTGVSNPELVIYLPTKEKANGTAIVICPGGGYGALGLTFEGDDIARWLNNMGIAGIVLKYRLPTDTIMKDKTIGPLQDVQEAIRIVRRKSKEWQIAPDKVGVIGFSAGGHLAATAATMYNEKVYQPTDTVSARPDFSILMYGVLSMQKHLAFGTRVLLLGANADQTLLNKFSNELRVDTHTPPAFIVHAADDKTVPFENSILYFQAMKKAGVSAELHIYEKGGHGFGLAKGRTTTEAGWTDACKAWLKIHGWLK
jgi:acetyl esterase/lipase